MKSKEVTLFGGTGLIGSLLLDILIEDNDYHKINVVTRKPISLNHKKIKIHIIAFSDSKSYSQTLKNSQIVFASIGTTQSKVKGNKESYHKIDFDIIYNIAKACKKNNVEKMNNILHFLEKCKKEPKFALVEKVISTEINKSETYFSSKISRSYSTKVAYPYFIRSKIINLFCITIR